MFISYSPYYLSVFDGYQWDLILLLFLASLLKLEA